MNKQTGDLSTVVIQTKTSESESYKVHTLTPYGSPDFKWSFGENTLNSQQTFVLSYSDMPHAMAGLLIYNDDITLGPFSSSWSNLKVYVKLYNGNAYPGFVEDEQNWTSFNSWDLEINPNSALYNSIFDATTQKESLTVASYITNDYLNPQNLDVGWNTFLQQTLEKPRTEGYFLTNNLENRWIMVRRQAPGTNLWHTATDRLQGTDVYGSGTVSYTHLRAPATDS